ncbi:hypothetical protein [Autumnicola psychrophila]|uniref:Uncharacterized protein n=1 Tax=Autumnicola psychrophila TaxID=3075592 RepID=A0ABU3DNR9_9FLAO|nr:hypothetical protein [Zunongwangia sp. F225]MDT0685258.1 hypothetical protein [Zunongwangia sp. F225]
MAVVLKEVEHSDFSQIHSLFAEVYGKQPDDGFKKAFFDHDQFLGNCLIDNTLANEPMVGYFGCFTYHRTIGGKNYKFYNSHTWIVKENYRKQSLKLLMPYLRLKDGIVTNFSANDKVAQILDQLKFSKIPIVNTIVKLSFSFRSYAAQRKIESLELQSDITRSHQPYVGLSLNLKLPNTDQNLELILKPIDKKPTWVQRINVTSKSITKRPIITKNYFLYKVHYTNAPDILLKNLDVLSHYLFLNGKIGGLVLPELFIENLPQNRVDKKYEDIIFIKSNQEQTPKIDFLFSEVFYLNIADK